MHFASLDNRLRSLTQQHFASRVLVLGERMSGEHNMYEDKVPPHLCVKIGLVSVREQEQLCLHV